MGDHGLYKSFYRTAFVLSLTTAGFTPLLFPAFATPALAQSYEQAAYIPEQLDQLTAPIALYPDPLLGQVLMASTYPEEVVQAERWRSGQLQLGDGELAAALEELPWDPSVKALTAFPEVLSMMTNNIEWTENLGDAFLSSQGAVMDSVQRLRQRAAAAGTLMTNPELSISTDDGMISIEPVDPGSVYVPWYNPSSVFSPWPYAGYAPYYFSPPYGYVSLHAGLFGFGGGIAVAGGLWGWDNWDWHHHFLRLDDHRWEALNGNRPPPAGFTGGEWHHDPAHRGGVPYESAAVSARFSQAAPVYANREFRGYSGAAPTATPATFANRNDVPQGDALNHHGYYTPGVPRTAYGQTHPVSGVPASAADENRAPEERFRQDPQGGVPQTRPVREMPPVVEAPQGAPLFESFSRGSQVREEAARGNSSARAGAPPRQEAPRQEAPRAAPSRPEPSGGGGGGGDRHR